MLNSIVKLFQALNSNKSSSEIAHACCMGVMLGFMPKNNAFWYIIFFFFMFVRINKGTYLVITALVSLFAWMLDPMFNSIGYSVLTYPPLEGFFSWLFDVPFVGFTRFNNTIVMGSFVFSMMLYIPIFVLIKILVKLWRKKIAIKFGDSAIVKFFQKIPLIRKIIEVKSEIDL